MSDLATRLRTACDQVRVKSYPLSDLIPLMQQAADALAAAPAQPAPSAAPGGFAVVPMDATDNMMAAFAKAAAAEVDWYGATEVERQEVRDGFGPAYRAMLAAAPTPQADSQPSMLHQEAARAMLKEMDMNDRVLAAIDAKTVNQADSQPAAPIDPAIAADLERSDWTPEEALRWYAAGKHYDTVPNGDGSSSARILDNGGVASNALKSLSREYAEHKGDVALAAPQADSQPAPVRDEREAFEAWIKKDCGDLSTFGSGKNIHYHNSAVNNAWSGWRARAARSPADSVTAPAGGVETKRYADGTTATGIGPLPKHSPSVQHALRVLTDVESMLGGANGPTIQIRAVLESLAAAEKPMGRVLLDSTEKPVIRPQLFDEKFLADPKAFYAMYPHRAPHRVADLYATPPAQAADSVLEDAERYPVRKFNRYCHAHMCQETDAQHEPDCPQGRAACKQGANHD